MCGKGRKYLNIIMNTLLEKVLTDRSSREPEAMEALAVAQDAFVSWDLS